jgi:hypothetical protein
VKLKQIILTSAYAIALGTGGLAHANTTYNWTWSTTLSGNPPANSTTWTPSTTTGDWCASMTTATMSTYGNCARWGGSETPASPATNVLQVTAFSNTGASSTIENAYLSFWGSSGVGVVNRSTGGSDSGEGLSTTPPSATNGEHSVDNQGRYDMVLLTFDRAISLTGVDIGWSQTDSDITVLAFNSAATPDSLVGQSYGSLQAGWQLVGHYADADKADGSAQGVSTAVTSRYWLVGAYNALISPTGWTTGNDFVKIKGFTASETVKKVPEPAGMSMALIALASGAFVTLRRRNRRAAAE